MKQNVFMNLREDILEQILWSMVCDRGVGSLTRMRSRSSVILRLRRSSMVLLMMVASLLDSENLTMVMFRL